MFYQLERDFSHLLDMDNDITHIKFPGSQDLGSKMMGVKDTELPNILYFQANFRVIPRIDYPIPDLSLFIVSGRMLDALKECGFFEYRSIPIVLIDDTYFGKIFNDNNELNTGFKINTDYLAIQLMRYTDAFDYEKSEYKSSRAFPDEVGVIKKLALKESENYPPVFKIKEKPSRIFITEQTKNNLVSRGIQGCEFKLV